MAVNLSPVYGVGGQLFDNNGNPLSGGKIYTYLAGTTTNAPTYTNSTGTIAHSNPIVLDGAGRVPSGEIWLTDGISYKFVVEDSASALIGTYDNLVGINSNFVNFLTEQEIQTATAGQTVFTLTTMQYQPGTNNLTVYVDGVNQYGPGASYSYVETSSTVVTFTSGLHVGAEVKFTTAQTLSSGATDASLVTYDPPFVGGIETTVENKLAQTVSVKDFGAVGDGVTDDTAAIQAAIDYVNGTAGGGIVTVTGSTLIESTLTIKAGVVLDFQWTPLTTTTDTDLIYINQGGQLKNCRINLESVTYSSTAVKFVPTDNVQGDRFIPWISGLAIKFQNYTVGSGTGVEIDGDTYYVQLTSAENISVRYGEKAIHLHGTGTGGLDYVNGNVFNGVVVMDSYYSFYLNQYANGNVFDGVVIERNNGATIYCEGSQNNWQGVAWDQVPIVVSGQGNNFGVIQTTRYGADITDTGIDNRSYSRAVSQFGNVSTNSLNDYRQGLYEPGRLEFRDFFLGSLDSHWTSTLAGNGAIAYGTATYGNATNNKQFSPYIRLSGTGAASGEVTLNFNGNNIVKVVQKPIIHATNYTTNTDARLTWRFGLWEDSNNHIYATQDVNLYGDDDIRLVCTSGGSSTTQAITTASFERISFMSIICLPTAVTLNIGQYNNTSTSSDGQVARGINKIFIDNLTTTVTTNITTSALEPYIYMKGNNASAAYIDFLDYQLIASRKAPE